MRKILFFPLLYTISQLSFSQTDYPKVVLETSAGNLVFQLYSDTPLHSKNFIKLVNAGYYDGQLFHRVINHFMIQAGDPDSKNAKSGQALGSGGPAYTIPSEINPLHFHKKGALAAARLSDDINPKKESSGSQFYIVHGRVFNYPELENMLKSGRHLPFTTEQVKAYTTIGGSPHLDNEYTVFGELIDGFEVLDAIASMPVDSNSRPLNDIIIYKAYTVK
jgi:cyclophilin family peptidyl-prolyl cis-trans isomerase